MGLKQPRTRSHASGACDDEDLRLDHESYEEVSESNGPTAARARSVP